MPSSQNENYEISLLASQSSGSKEQLRSLRVFIRGVDLAHFLVFVFFGCSSISYIFQYLSDYIQSKKLINNIQQIHRLMQIEHPLQLEEISQLMHELNIQDYFVPQLYCGSNNRITFMCLNRFCNDNPSLHCQKQDCPSCQNHYSRRCGIIQLDTLNNLLNHKTYNLRYLMEQMMKVELYMLKELQKRKKQMLSKINKFNLNETEMDVIKSMFENSNSWRNIRGSQTCEIVTKLKKNNQRLRVDDQLSIFKEKMSEITDQIFEYQSKNIREIIKPTKQYVQFPSKILQRDGEGMRYVLRELNYPLQINLLFRASEHEFSAKRFHQICDYIPNTLTVIRTVHNKVIAGFTPLTWETQDKEGYPLFKYDNNFQTFVISVTHKQRYQLKTYAQEQKFAIDCYPTQGPGFGQGDFAIVTWKDRIGTYLHSNFPDSFDYGKSYLNRNDAIQRILGRPVDQHVQIDEYEVFEILGDPQRQRY